MFRNAFHDYMRQHLQHRFLNPNNYISLLPRNVYSNFIEPMILNEEVRIPNGLKKIPLSTQAKKRLYRSLLEDQILLNDVSALSGDKNCHDFYTLPICALLDSNPANLFNEICMCAHQGNQDILQFLLSLLLASKAPYENYASAAYFQFTDILKGNEWSTTAMEIAAAAGHNHCLIILLNEKANHLRQLNIHSHVQHNFESNLVAENTMATIAEAALLGDRSETLLTLFDYLNEDGHKYGLQWYDIAAQIAPSAERQDSYRCLEAIKFSARLYLSQHPTLLFTSTFKTQLFFKKYAPDIVDILPSQRQTHSHHVSRSTNCFSSIYHFFQSACISSRPKKNSYTTLTPPKFDR